MSFWNHSIAELLEKGGPLMWPLLGCSVVALALVADRWIALVAVRIDFPRFIRELEKDVSASPRIAAERCKRHRGPIARVAEVYLSSLAMSDHHRASIIEREGSLALERVERRLRALATIAQVSTLLGLLGTVAGLVSAFHEIELASGQVDPDRLAGGIWAALLTTVFGLSIAIPSLLCFHAFESRVDEIAKRMSHVVSYLDEWLERSTPHPIPRALAAKEEP